MALIGLTRLGVRAAAERKACKKCRMQSKSSTTPGCAAPGLSASQCVGIVRLDDFFSEL